MYKAFLRYTVGKDNKVVLCHYPDKQDLIGSTTFVEYHNPVSLNDSLKRLSITPFFHCLWHKDTPLEKINENIEQMQGKCVTDNSLTLFSQENLQNRVDVHLRAGDWVVVYGLQSTILPVKKSNELVVSQKIESDFLGWLVLPVPALDDDSLDKQAGYCQTIQDTLKTHYNHELAKMIELQAGSEPTSDFARNHTKEVHPPANPLHSPVMEQNKPVLSQAGNLTAEKSHPITPPKNPLNKNMKLIAGVGMALGLTLMIGYLGFGLLKKTEGQAIAGGDGSTISNPTARAENSTVSLQASSGVPRNELQVIENITGKDMGGGSHKEMTQDDIIQLTAQIEKSVAEKTQGMDFRSPEYASIVRQEAMQAYLKMSGIDMSKQAELGCLLQ